MMVREISIHPGSHNPPEYNGFKIMIAGETLSGDRIQELYKRIIIPEEAGLSVLKGAVLFGHKPDYITGKWRRLNHRTKGFVLMTFTKRIDRGKWNCHVYLAGSVCFYSTFDQTTSSPWSKMF
jgi:hypothetical protein